MVYIHIAYIWASFTEFINHQFKFDRSDASCCSNYQIHNTDNLRWGLQPKQINKMDCTAYNVANNTGADILYINFNQDYR